MQDQIKDIDRPTDMAEFSELIIDTLTKTDEASFHQNPVIHFGLLKMMENIGEAAYQISRKTKAEFPVLEWDKIMKARHVYVHDYFKIDWIRLGRV